MNIKEYMEDTARTCPQLGTDFWDQLHMVIGISTESGELLDVFKKALAYSKGLDFVNIGEEIGDILWYLINLCRMLNLDPEEIMQININKLKARYPEKFTKEKALNRNLDQEREILESLGFYSVDKETGETRLANISEVEEISEFLRHKVGSGSFQNKLLGE